MRLLLGAALIGISGFLFTHLLNASSSEAATIITRHQVVASGTPAVSVTAPAYGVFDLKSGSMLFGENLTDSRPIASITKLFTAANALEYLELETTVTVTALDVATEGRAGKLAPGQELTVRELLFPLLLESSNDAAAALERQLGSVSYGYRPFADGSGLSDENQASVTELAFLIRTLYQREPHVFDMTTLSQYIGPYTGWVNNSPVADLPGYAGGKHGYTHAANRTLAAVFSEPHLGERKLVYVLLGSDDLLGDTKALRAAVADSVVLR